MKRVIKISAFACVFALLFGINTFALNPRGTTVLWDLSGINLFLKPGETPDISSGSVTIDYPSGEHIVKPLGNGMLSSGIDYTKPGLCPVPVTAENQTTVITFIIVDDSKKCTFTDFDRTYWGYIPIMRCVRAGFLSGVSDTRFNTSGDMTRAQFCQMIYNIYKNDSSVFYDGEAVGFDDVKADAWYHTAVTACAKAKIVNGVGNNKFNPDKPIKREDVALIMMRVIYPEWQISATDVNSELERAHLYGITANDFDDTSDYAKNAMALSLGVIFNGDDTGNIRPKNNIRRVECASLLSNYFFDGYTDPVGKPLVYLSPSNQMSNKYTGVDTTEGIEMNKVALVTKNKLISLGYDVYVADVSTSIQESAQNNRQSEAKKLGADCYVAIHSNAVTGENNGKYQGATCFYNGNNKGAKELATAVYNRVSALTPTKDNGVKNDMLTERPYLEVRLPEMANLILETEFHDYPAYAKWITENTTQLGEAIAYGIDDYFKSYGM